MMSVPVDKFVRAIREELEDENYDPVIGIGVSGVGKTVSVCEMARKLGIGFKEMRLVTLGQLDMLGLPYIENNRTTYAANELLPDAERDGEVGILVLDEITSAEKDVRAAAYQLLDSKRSLGNYHLPDKWKIVALGNGPDDGGVFNGIENAFLSRCTCYRIEPDLDAWAKWATEHGVNGAVIAFLKYSPTSLHKMNADEMASVFPCPRSWTTLAKKITAREAKSKTGILSMDDCEFYAAGCVGVQIAPEFAQFYSYTGDAVEPEDVLSGKSKPEEMKNSETQAVYLTIEKVVALMNQKLAAMGMTDTSDITEEAYQLCAVAANWLLGLGKIRLDYAISAFNSLGTCAASHVMMQHAFDEYCPDFMKFTEDNSSIY